MEPPRERARPLIASARSIASRAWAEAKEAARATIKHAVCVKDYGQHRWRRNRLASEDLASRILLGHRMHELSLGDVAQRGQIQQLQERIRSLEAAGASAKPVQAELRAAQAALAASALEHGVALAGAEGESQAAQAARSALLSQQQEVSHSQAALRPADRQQTLRIGAGYAVALLVLVATVRAWGPLGTATPGPAPGFNPAPALGEPVADGGFAPGVPSTPTPAPVFTPTPTSNSCANCFGTGQANCSGCFGEGKRTCFACNGRGTQPNSANNFQRLQCFQCNGTGKQSCTFCQYGKVQCPFCLGAGRVRG